MNEISFFIRMFSLCRSHNSLEEGDEELKKEEDHVVSSPLLIFRTR